MKYNGGYARIDDVEDLLDRYDELLRELGIDCVGYFYADDGMNPPRIPIVIPAGLCYVDLETYKKIEESNIKNDNLIIKGNRLYDKTTYMEREQLHKDCVPFSSYIYESYYTELLTIASKKMHSLYPKEVEKIWSEIGKRFGLNGEQSQALRHICYQPFYPNYEGEYVFSEEIGDYDVDSDYDFDTAKEIKEYGLDDFLQKMHEWSEHYDCSPKECKIDASRAERCKELHALFDNKSW